MKRGTILYVAIGITVGCLVNNQLDWYLFHQHSTGNILYRALILAATVVVGLGAYSLFSFITRRARPA